MLRYNIQSNPDGRRLEQLLKLNKLMLTENP